MQLIAVVHQNLCRAQTDRGMTVMPAGMHGVLVNRRKAIVGREMSLVMGFLNGQGIDVEAQGNRRSFPAVQDADDTGEAVLRGRQEFGIAALGFGSLIGRIQLLLSRDTHPGLVIADIAADQDFIKAHLGQLAGNQGTRPHFFKAQFGVFMEVAAGGDQFRFHLLRHLEHVLCYRHILPLFLSQNAGNMVMTQKTFRMHIRMAGSQDILNMVFWS